MTTHSHADALRALLSTRTASEDGSVMVKQLATCREFVAGKVPCKTWLRPHDLALQTFAEASDPAWHLDVGHAPSPRRLLFEEYLASGLIELDGAVHDSTARHSIGTTSQWPQRISSLEFAMRYPSAPTAVALLRAGADYSSVMTARNATTSNSVRSALFIPGGPDIHPLLEDAMVEALMHRRSAHVYWHPKKRRATASARA